MSNTMSERKLSIYHNPDCSKSRETMRLLEQHNQTPEVFEYLNNPPSKQTLKEIIARLGIPVRELIRTNEAAYTEAGLNIDTMSEDDIIDAIHNYPVLLQRPIVVFGDKAVIGRPPARVLDLFQ
jgi:arsenate reductase